MLIVTVLTFVGFELIKSDAAIRILGTEATAEQLAALRHQMGLDRPMPIRFIDYISKVFKGDLGESYIYKEPVANMLSDKIFITLSMTFIAMLIVVILSYAVAILCVMFKGGALEKIIIITNQIIMSVPPFFSGMIITLLFGFGLKWFMPGGFVSYKEDLGGFIRYMIFPSIAIALPKCAMAAKLLIGSIHDECGNPYVKTALSRGNSKMKILIKHVLKNASLPVVTFLAMAMTSMLASSIVVEQVFGIPGISRLLVTGIANRDFPLVQAIILFVAICVAGINLFVDIIYSILDPRIRVE